LKLTYSKKLEDDPAPFYKAISLFDPLSSSPCLCQVAVTCFFYLPTIYLPTEARVLSEF